MNKARYRWCGPDTYVANDKAEENLKMLFEEKDRLPRYDQQVGGWHLSKKFADELKGTAQEEDQQAEEIKVRNPFMADYI